MAGFPSLLESPFSGWTSLDDPVFRDVSKSKTFLRLAPPPSDPQSSLNAKALVSLVENQIVPGLLLAHKTTGEVVKLRPDPRPAQLDVEKFAGLVVNEGCEILTAHVSGLLDDGRSIETLYTELLMPASRRLIEFWGQDVISSAELTIGVGRLQQVVRTLWWRFPAPYRSDHDDRSALFLPCLGERHTFGLTVSEDLFRRAGWRTWVDTSPQALDGFDEARCGGVDLIYLSASINISSESVCDTITAWRRIARTRTLTIMVGGELFDRAPELAAEVGADLSSPAGREALLIADKAVRRRLCEA